jgi:hypothetical protein
MKSTIFSDITPFSPLSVNRRSGGKYHLHFQGRRKKFEQDISLKAGGKQSWFPPAFTLVSCTAYFFDPEDGGDCSCETSVDTQRTTRRYIPEYGTLQLVRY